MKAKTFKEIVNTLAAAENKEDIYSAMGDIDRAFCAEKITWKDHENLYAIAEVLSASPYLTDK